MSELETFDLRGPLPTGTTLLEASAGTGKTFTIAALVTRFVAEGVASLDKMLIVTFGRMASQELRERVRAQLVEAERALGHTDAEPANDLIALLLDCDAPERAARRERLREALGAFDDATIATTHQFCHLVLRSLGVAGDTDANATLVEDLEDLLGEVVDDLYLKSFAHLTERPPFTHAVAMSLARAAVNDPQAELEPSDADPETLPGQRVRFVSEVRAELDRRKRRLGVLSYDDLLSQLADALQRDDADARQRMRQRWEIVLVDEFQDTDPVQWQVLDRAFNGHATMVLIGDPKQAIYAFRGGDVTTYLAAAATATNRMTLGTNWRSDSALLDPVQAVLRGAALGDEQIVVRDVEAAHEGSRLAGAGAPFRLRALSHRSLGIRPTGKVTIQPIRDFLYPDVARDIKRLLTSDATFDGNPILPRDVAVLAYRNKDLQAVQLALAEVGVPAVVAGSGSVFGTPAAVQWLQLLEALEQPHRSARVRSAALTAFVGRTADELDAGGDDLTDEIAEMMRDWSELFGSRGVAAVLEAAGTGGLAARVLSQIGGERLLTDLRHVGQSLHQVGIEHRMGLVAMLTWLRSQMAEDKVEVASDRTRRLDSDAAAVQLVTIHGSKGLEYPVVYLPFQWDRYPQKVTVPLFHQDTGARSIDVGGSGPQWGVNVRRAQQEDNGESLRLLYVAMTRAKSQLVAWWAPAPRNTPASALHRIMFGRRPGWSEVPAERELYPDAQVPEILRSWQAHGGPVWEEAAEIALPDIALPVDERELGVRTFDRWIDATWRRTSYSSLIAVADDRQPAGVSSEPQEPPKDDEPELVLPPGELGVPAVVSPMSALPVGATFGSLVHAVLEHADPEAVDLHQEMADQIAEQLVQWPVLLDVDELARALVLVCDSPLGPLAPGLTLRQVAQRERLCELDFELPLAGGDDREYHADHVRLRDLAPILRRHLAEGDPLLPYADAVEHPVLGDQDLRGYLTGSVDVVLRVQADGQPRYLVVDYKTNWLGAASPGEEDTPLTSADYRPEMLAAAMGHSDYPLQALLYAVVLHRYLRWRQPDYVPEQHLGGVLYLYLRGMCGPDTPLTDGEPAGVFSWHPPASLVAELSDLLDGVPPAQGVGG